MINTIEALKIFIFLIPGFLTIKIIEFLRTRGSWDSATEVIVKGFLWSIFIWIIYYCFANYFGFLVKPIYYDGKDLVMSQNILDLQSLLFLIAIAILLGIITSVLLNNGWLFKALRILHLTRMTGEDDAWVSMFSRYGRIWIKVTLKDGHEFVGWPEFYSESNEKKSIVLTDVSVYPPKGKMYEVNNVFINENSDIHFIQILNEVINNGKKGQK